jgi:hypothetical protein
MSLLFDEAFSYDIDITESEKIDLILEGLRPNRAYETYIIHFTIQRSTQTRNSKADSDTLSLLDIEREINSFDCTNARPTVSSNNSTIRYPTNHGSAFRPFNQSNNHRSRAMYAPGITPPNRTTYYSANQVESISYAKKPVKCFHCGGAHRISDCKQATPQQKKDLWEQYRQSKTSTQPPSPRQVQQSSAAISDVRHPVPKTKKNVHWSSQKRPPPNLEANMIEFKVEPVSPLPSLPSSPIPPPFPLVPIKLEFTGNTPPPSPYHIGTTTPPPTSPPTSDSSPTSPLYSPCSPCYSPPPNYLCMTPLLTPVTSPTIVPSVFPFHTLPPPPLYVQQPAHIPPILRPSSYPLPPPTTFVQSFDFTVPDIVTSILAHSTVTDNESSPLKRKRCTTPLPHFTPHQVWQMSLDEFTDDDSLVSPPQTKARIMLAPNPDDCSDEDLFGHDDSISTTGYACAISSNTSLSPSSYRGFPPIHRELLGTNPSIYWLPDSGTTAHMTPFVCDLDDGSFQPC